MKKTAFVLLELQGYDTNKPLGTSRVFAKLFDFLDNENIEYFKFINCKTDVFSRLKALLTNFFKILKNKNNINKIIIQSKEDTYILMFFLHKFINKNTSITLLHMDIHNENNPYTDTSKKIMTFFEKKCFKFIDEIYFMNREHQNAYKNYEINGKINLEMLSFFENKIENNPRTKTNKFFYAGYLDEPRKKLLEDFAKELFETHPEITIEVYGNNLSSKLKNLEFKNTYLDLASKGGIKHVQINFDAAIVITVECKMFASKIRDIYSYSMPIISVTAQQENTSFKEEIELVGGHNFNPNTNQSLEFINDLKLPKNVEKFSIGTNKEKLLKILT